MNTAEALDETRDALAIVGHVVDGLPAARFTITDPARRARVREAQEEAAAAWRHLCRVVVALDDRPRQLPDR